MSILMTSSGLFYLNPNRMFWTIKKWSSYKIGLSKANIIINYVVWTQDAGNLAEWNVLTRLFVVSNLFLVTCEAQPRPAGNVLFLPSQVCRSGSSIDQRAGPPINFWTVLSRAHVPFWDPGRVVIGHIAGWKVLLGDLSSLLHLNLPKQKIEISQPISTWSSRKEESYSHI